MLIDYNSLGGTAPPATDVVVVGSGAAGFSMATELARFGLTVLIVEAGNFSNDRKILADDFQTDVVKNHAEGHLYRRRMVGGTTTVWGGRCIPYEQSDFQDLSAGDGARWPIKYDEVQPFILPAMTWLQAGDSNFYAEQALPNRPRQMVPSDDNSVSLDEIERFSLPTNSWRSHGQALVRGKNVHLLYNCMVVELVGNHANEASYDIRVATPDGKSQNIKCPILVLATGGLETPRLLLASRSNRPQGVGNEADLVGRFFMTHVIADLGQLKVYNKKLVALNYENAKDGAYVRRLIKVAPEKRKELNLMNLIARPAMPNFADPKHESAVLSLAFLAKRFVIQEYRDRIIQEYAGSQVGLAPHFANIIKSTPSLATFGVDWIFRRILASRKLPALFLDGAASYPLQIIGEQAPLRRSRISLSDKKDRYGVPRINIDWQTCSDDAISMDLSMRTIERSLSNNKIARIELSELEYENLPNMLVPQGGHHIGTARMANSPADGVTDQWGKVWGSSNLYIAGSAVFPRSGVANPTLMIVAMTLRTAQHIKNNKYNK